MADNLLRNLNPLLLQRTNDSDAAAALIFLAVAVLAGAIVFLIYKYSSTSEFKAPSTQRRFQMISPIVSPNLGYEDNDIQVYFAISNKVLFQLANKTNEAIKLDWNQVSFVDPFGFAHRVFHTGVRYLERSAIQAPTFVPPHARIDDSFLPTENVDYNYQTNTGWRERPLFQSMPAVGQSFSVFMPLEIGSTLKSYHFIFQVIESQQ